MIPLSLGQIVFVYTAVCVVTILLISGASHFLHGCAERRARRRQIQCAFCGVIYESSDAKDPLPRCPACAHPNERVAPLGV